MKTERDKIIEVLKAELFPMQLVDDSDPIVIIGFDKAADRILSIQQEGAKDRVEKAWKYLEEQESLSIGGVVSYFSDSIAVKALKLAAGLDEPTK